MVHDLTPLDNWYHEIVNHMAVAANYTRIATDDLQDGENIVEVAVMLKKVTQRHDKIMSMIREDYIERKRLEQKTSE